MKTIKLNEYIKYLQQIKKENKYQNLDLYYAIDDEGNGFGKVLFTPQVVYITKEDAKENIITDYYTKKDIERDNTTALDITHIGATVETELDKYVKVVLIN
jgi:hypothetical protein